MRAGNPVKLITGKGETMMNMRSITAVAVVLAISACGNDKETMSDQDSGSEPQQAVAIDVSSIESVEIVPGLSRRILQDGSGAVAAAGQTAVVHYTGWLFDASAQNSRGDKFDSSRDRGVHFEFPLGGGRVIKGWDQGVIGMHVGEIRELTIAPEMAYGDRQVGALIPPGSTLVFEVELADLKDPGQEQSDTP